MITKEEVGDILRRAFDEKEYKAARDKAILQGIVVDLDTERRSKSYPPDHPVSLCRGLHWSLGQLRLLSEACHEGWFNQVLLDNLDQSIKTIQDVEDVLREAKP